MAGWKWISPQQKKQQEVGFWNNFIGQLQANGAIPNPETYKLPAINGPSPVVYQPPPQAAPQPSAPDDGSGGGGFEMPDWAKPIMSYAKDWAGETGSDIAGAVRPKRSASLVTQLGTDLKNVSDVAGDVLRPFNQVVDQLSQKTLQPLFGALGGTLGEDQVVRPDAEGNPTTVRENKSLADIIRDPQAYFGAVAEGFHHPGRAQESWQEHLAGEEGLLQTPYRVGAAVATQPASYLDPAMAPLLPEAVQGSKAFKFGMEAVGQPGRAAVGAGAGSAVLTAAGEQNDAPEWMKPYLPIIGALGGWFAGGHFSATIGKEQELEHALAKWQGLPDGASPGFGLSMFDSSKADAKTQILRNQHKPATEPILLFHTTQNDGFLFPDPALSTGGAVGSTRGEGLYTTAALERSARYGGATGGRMFVIQPDADVMWHDLTRVGPSSAPMLSSDGGTTMAGPSWDNVQERMVKELRAKGLHKAADKVEKAFGPTSMKNAFENDTPTGLKANRAAWDRKTGEANGYVYRAALVNALHAAGEDIPQSFLGRFMSSVDTAATNAKKGSVYVQETLGDMGVDGFYHDSATADGDTYVILNSKKFKVVGEGKNIRSVANAMTDGQTTYDLHKAVEAAKRAHSGRPEDMPSFASFGGSNPLSNIGRAIRFSRDTPNGIAFGSTDVPFGMPQLAAADLTAKDKATNALRRVTNRVQEHPAVAPAMRWRQSAGQIIESQAQRVFSISKPLVEDAFPTITKAGEQGRFGNGRISDLPGMPTVQDVAARLPTFRPFLNPKQLAAMEKLADEVQVYTARLEEVGVHLGQRPDIEPGGFYLPRGRADVEGSDGAMVPGQRPAYGRAGGKKGYQKGAVFDSMADGIEKGYVYAPIEEALRAHVADAGRQIVDQHVADYFAKMKDADGNLIGQTPEARLISQNGPIKTKVEGLRKALESMTQTGQRLTATQQRVIDDFMNNPAPDVDALRDALANIKVGPSATGAVGPNFGKTQAELRTAVQDVRNQLRDLAPEWKAAVDKARAMPRDQNGINFGQLQGTSFPDAISQAANRYLNKELPTGGVHGEDVGAYMALNNILRGVKATADISFAGIQGIIGAATHPIDYAKAMVVTGKALGNPDALGDYLLKFDQKALEMGTPTSRDLIANGLHIGGAKTEFAIGGGVNQFVHHLTDWTPIRLSDRSFGYFTDAQRVELASTAYMNALKHGENMTLPENLKAVTSAANMATGWSPTTFGGSVGQLTMFAPRFFQSQLDMIMALPKGGVLGHEARDMMVKYVGISVGLTFLANEASGQPIDREEMLKPWSANFMRFRFQGQDVSLLGPWDSLLRGIIFAARGDPGYIARSKANPVISQAWDLISGSDFSGRDTHLDKEGGGFEAIARNLLPFSLNQVDPDTFGTKTGPWQLGIGMTGLKSTPETPSEQLDALSMAQYQGKAFRDLSPQESKLMKEQHPDIWQRKVESGSAEEQAYNRAKEASAEEQQAADDAASGKIAGQNLTKKQWRDEYNTRRDKLVGVGQQIYGKPKHTDDPTSWRDFYGNIMVDATKADGSIDWTQADGAIAKLPDEFQKNIIEQRFIGSTAMVEEYKKATALRSQMYAQQKYEGYSGSDAGAIDRALADVKAQSGSKPPVSVQIQVLSRVRGLTPAQLRGATDAIYGTLKSVPATYPSKVVPGKRLTPRQAFAEANPLIAVFYGPGDF